MAAGLGRNKLNEVDVIQFDVLPDDVLLDIFDFSMDTSRSSRDKKSVEAWQTLVHVCRRWRSLVFRSPRRLNLRLYCTPETRARDTLDVWPALPLIVKSRIAIASSTDDIIAALGHSNRVSEVALWNLEDQQLEEVSAAMQVPFPELTDLELSSRGGTLVIPDSFLGGSAPSLRYIYFSGISFPGLPNLLLFATHLVELWLYNIPLSGYISPEALVASISALFSLEKLYLEFDYPRSHHGLETQLRPPLKRSILPSLKNVQFEGVTEYLEDLVTLIDAPQLNSLELTLFDELNFDVQRVAQFINRTPKLSECDEAHLLFNDWNARIQLGTLQISIPGCEPVWQLSSVSKFGSFSIPCTAKDLYIECGIPHLIWKNDGIEDTLWLQLLLPFTAVKNLYISEEFVPIIAVALQGLVGGRVTEVLPSLQNIFVEELELFEKDIEQFVVARQLSGHPIAVFDWDRNSDSDTESM